jgi:hypothetical protein
MQTKSTRKSKPKTYPVYDFKAKDPVIEILLSLVNLEMRVSSRAFDAVLRSVAENSGVSYGCLLGWFYGATISPRFCNIQRVAHALGVTFSPHPVEPSKPSAH